jgi:hypothetical protein
LLYVDARVPIFVSFRRAFDTSESLTDAIYTTRVQMSSQNIEEAAKIKSRSEKAMATQPDNSCQIAAANKCSHKEDGSEGLPGLHGLARLFTKR